MKMNLAFSAYECRGITSQSPEAETLRGNNNLNKYYLIIVFFFISNIAHSQSKRGNVWVSGTDKSFVIDFSNGSIKSKYFDSTNVHFFGIGNSCISDTIGDLVLSSDGYNIYNKGSVFIDGGDTLIPNDFYVEHNGFSSLSQSSIFLPMDSNQYYFITPTCSNIRYNECYNTIGGNCYFDLLLYNVIDMNANGGAGKVVQRMVPLLEHANFRKTQMMACRHANGKDWWLLKNEGDSADVHTFLFTQDSVFDKGVQKFAEPVWGVWDIRGQSAFNVEGTQFATTSHGSSTGLIFLADFDRCYGKLSNPKVIQMPAGSQHIPSDTTITERLSVGLAYSPNGEFLYVASMSNIYQYDLQDETWFHVAGLDTTYDKFQNYETAYLGPDDRIYIGNWGGGSKQMSRIDNPNVKGSGCDFCPRCLRLDTLSTSQGNFSVGTPPCMPN